MTTERSIIPGGWKGYAVIFTVFAVFYALWIDMSYDMSDMVTDTARERMAYTVAKAAFPYGGAACHAAAASDIKTIIADVDARARGETNAIFGYAFPDVDHANVKQAVGEWLDDGPAAPYGCSSNPRGMGADAHGNGVDKN